MLKKMTRQQEDGMIEWRDKCLAIGRDTSPVDRKTTEEVFTKFYKLLGLKKPKFWYCQSPLSANIIINMLLNNIVNNIWNNIGG